MKIAAYVSPQHRSASAFIESTGASGDAVLWRRGSLWTPDQRCRDIDLVVSLGARGAHGTLIHDYAGWGVPAVVIDLQRYRAIDGTGVYLGGLQALPPCGVPGRREALAPNAVQPVRTDGRHILVLGQRPLDASHGLGEAGLTDWLVAATEQAVADTGLPVVYRSHPRGEAVPFPYPHTEDDRTQPISFDGAALVVTYCSTAGFEAILAGVPVRCHGSAFYAPWADLSGDREDLLDRVLATQWSDAELAGGVAWDFVSWWLTVWRGRWDGAPPAIRHSPVHVEYPATVGVYADQTQEWAAEMATAIEAAGSAVVWRQKYRATELDAKGFGAVLCYGARRGHAALLAGCTARGVPAVIGDLPRYRALPDHYGFFAGDLHALPPVGVPGRREQLAPDAVQPIQYGGDHILVLGQKPGDASHGLSLLELEQWLTERATEAAEETGLPVVYRPHPYCTRPTKLGCDHTVQPPDDPLSFDGVSRVICYTSTGGFEAVLAGVPVTCDPRAFYAPWSDLGRDREDLLDLVLATQWSPDERRDGTAWQFLWRWASGQLARETAEASALAANPLAVA